MKTDVKSYFFVNNQVRTHYCNHPVYSKCTLFYNGKKGLAVIQQRYIPSTKLTYWCNIDRDLIPEIQNNSKFTSFFEHFARDADAHDCYPTVTIRQIMWALRMRPLPKQPWETIFDHKPL